MTCMHVLSKDSRHALVFPSSHGSHHAHPLGLLTGCFVTQFCETIYKYSLLAPQKKHVRQMPKGRNYGIKQCISITVLLQELFQGGWFTGSSQAPVLHMTPQLLKRFHLTFAFYYLALT